MANESTNKDRLWQLQQEREKARAEEVEAKNKLRQLQSGNKTF